MSDHPIMLEMRREWNLKFHGTHPTQKLNDFFAHMERVCEEYSRSRCAPKDELIEALAVLANPENYGTGRRFTTYSDVMAFVQSAMAPPAEEGTGS